MSDEQSCYTIQYRWKSHRRLRFMRLCLALPVDVSRVIIDKVFEDIRKDRNQEERILDRIQQATGLTDAIIAWNDAVNFVINPSRFRLWRLHYRKWINYIIECDYYASTEAPYTYDLDIALSHMFGRIKSGISGSSM